MKTLNLTLRTILLALALVGTTTTALAYDMLVDGVYYNIYGNEAKVTYITYSYSDGYNKYSKYSGHITIPETVTYNGMTYTVTGINAGAFANCTSLVSVSIPETITTIAAEAFSSCRALKNIGIPNSISAIGDQAFWDCDGLTSITIPNSVTSIGAYAFYDCTNMSSVTIGSAVTSIGSEAFRYTPLAYITCLADTPPSLNSGNLYFNSYVNTTLYVPQSSIELYQSASVWSKFKIITDFKPNFFSLDDVSTMHGDTIVIPVKMENENEITAFQTDICLVDGFELLKDGDEYLVELSDRKGRDHVIMANETPDGNIRVASYSSSLKTFKNNEGELFYVTIKVPENGNGVYPIVLKNTRMTTIDEDEVLSPDVFCNVTVFPFIKGDADKSGDVTVTDVVVTAKYILFQNPDPFDLEAADMNSDGKITITDAVKIAHLVLDQDYDEPTDMNLRASGMAGDRMSGDMANNGTVSINLDNAQEYTALQMDLTLPEGMTASDFALTNRASGLNLSVKDKGNGKIRVLGYALDLKTIKDHDGAVLTFKVDGTMGEIIVDRIELVNTSGESYRLNGFSIMANNPTAIDEMTAGKTVASVDYFNLAGHKSGKILDEEHFAAAYHLELTHYEPDTPDDKVYLGHTDGTVNMDLAKTIVELTGGDSLESNIKLVLNNAAVGSEVAKEYCKIK